MFLLVVLDENLLLHSVSSTSQTDSTFSECKPHAVANTGEIPRIVCKVVAEKRR
tara:strand:- start:471 stop:632 length:162 start_codon:yes stop_codon:yes gene_type:complete